MMNDVGRTVVALPDDIPLPYPLVKQRNVGKNETF